MTAFELKYTPSRRKAIFAARFEQAMTYERIAEQAASGELVPGDAFDINPEYLARLCRHEAKKRKGQHNSLLADKPHRDAVETLRRRLIAVADAMSADLVAQADKDPAKIDPVRFKQVIACVREASAVPTLKDDRPAAPGEQRAGERAPQTSRHGVAGSLLRAARETTSVNSPADVAENDETPLGGGVSDPAGGRR